MPPPRCRIESKVHSVASASPCPLPQWGRGLRRVGEAQPSPTRSWVRGCSRSSGLRPSRRIGTDTDIIDLLLFCRVQLFPRVLDLGDGRDLDVDDLSLGLLDAADIDVLDDVPGLGID